MKTKNIPHHKDSTTAIALDTISQDKQTLIFCSSKKSAESQAEKIAVAYKIIKPEYEDLAEKALKTLANPTSQCKRLAKCLAHGIAFHHAGLAAKQRELVEESFRKGIITTICSTPTLCISGKENIWNGINEINIAKARKGQKLIALRENELFTMRCDKIEKQDNQSKLIEITSTSNFKIRITPNHKMYVRRGEKKLIIPANKIKKTDRIATIGKIPKIQTTQAKIKDFVKDHDCPVKQKTIGSKIAYLIGVMLGDGYSGAETKNNKIIYKGSPCIVGIDQELFDRIKNVVKELNISSKQTKNSKGTPQLILGKNNWFREFLVRCGVEKGEQKHINENLMKLPKKQIIQLLQGLFDTDGYVEKRGNIGFSNTSKQLVKQIQKQLLRFGIVSRIRKRIRSPMKIYEKEYQTKPQLELLITQKKCILTFQKEIGFFLNRKQRELNKITTKIQSNILYSECKQCKYKIHKELFSGRTKTQNIWGEQKKKIIKLLNKEGELSSKELTKKLKFLPRKKESRTNLHYQLITKTKKTQRDWHWSLNKIGKYIATKHITKKTFEKFFEKENCPICKNKLNKVLKKGWRDNDFEGDIFWDIIRNIKTVKEEKEVYNVVLGSKPQNDHLFVCNGFITHNSAGLDLPAFRAIVRDTKRFGNRGMAPIQVLEYEQMSGRAGRPGKEDYGEAILIAKTKDEIEKLTEHYINGEVEDIYSKLAVEPVLRTYVLSLVTSKIIKDTEELYSFFDKTFYAHQFGDLERLHATLDKMIKLLVDWKFLEGKNKPENKEKKSMFSTAAELFSKEKTIEPLIATELGKRVSELYLDPLTANLIISQINILSNKITNTADNEIKSEEDIQLLHILSCTLELRPLLRVGVKDVENIVAFKEEHYLIIDEEKFYEQSQDDYDNTIKTTLFLIDWINEYTEERLLEKYNIRPGEITAKLQRIDWLLYATDELARMTNQKLLLKEIRNLRTRVKHGVKQELLPLLNFKGIGRVRARKLYYNKIKSINDVKKASPQTLAQLIGEKMTINIKEQVGEKVTVDLKDIIKKRPSKHRKQTQLSYFN